MNYNLLRMIRHTNDWLVWRGEHPASALRCLVKQPQPSSETARLASSLAEEYAFFQQLQHPHLLRPLHWDPTAPGLVFEDMQCSLAQLVEQQRFAVDQTVRVMLQALDALAYLHERQLGHGCVNTQTILVDPQGDIKLGDFLGYRFDGGAPPPDIEMKYQAPELLDSSLGYSGPTSDLYCLGHAALEMILGEQYPLLFAGPGCSAADVQANWLGWHAHPDRELTGLAQSLPLVPPVLLDIVQRMIRKDSSERGFRSATEARQALLTTGLASTQPLPPLRDTPEAPEEPLPEAIPIPTESERVPRSSAHRGRSLSLIWTRGGQEQRARFSANQAIVVGCDPVCELPFANVKGVSRRHALLAYQAPGQWWAYDLHSTQGTWHNGSSIRAARLRPGDELRFGPVRCRVEYVERKKTDRQIGPFRLLGRIHQGRNGTLYRASWIGNAARPVVAVRVFPEEFQFDSEQIRRFLRGIPQAAAFRHPNLLRLFRGGSFRKGSRRLWFIAMEHMPGGSLRDRMAKKGRLSVQEALRCARDVLGALRAIADQRLLHRNLTPSCILFDEQEQAKVGDFVMMRGDAVDSFQQITRAGSPPAEHIYQAPEQIQGIRDLTPSCDLYSLAAILYEALTGQPPFPTNLRLPDTINAICHQPIVPPRSLNPALPAEIDSLLLVALDKKPQRRIQSAQEFAQRLPSS
jgi:serine/threonine protein kinase